MKSISRSAVALLGGAAALCTGLLASVPAAPTATAASVPRPAVRVRPPSQPRYDVGVKHSIAPNAIIPAATTTVNHFTATVTDGSNGQKYTYSMVGKNPAIPVTNATTKVTADVVPLVIKYAGLTWDPTQIDGCDTAATPLTRVQNSPIFKAHAYQWGGNAIGKHQVTDAFQRANFWTYAKTGGTNPTYNVNLVLKTLPAVTINVPTGDSYTGYGDNCGNGTLGAVDITWLDPYLQNTVIPSLQSEGVSPKTFPIFLVHNVVEYQTSAGNCCILGYHNAYSDSQGVQTYGLSIYDNSGDFNGSSDISALSHEVGEWMDDPFGNNPTPPWGHIGQVSGCQSNLEVGDPLSGTVYPVTINAFTYHPQELAFFSWFYHQSPSLGVNGWYSDQGTFTTPAAPCS